MNAIYEEYELYDNLSDGTITITEGISCLATGRFWIV
jgi:hypothetical protein